MATDYGLGDDDDAWDIDLLDDLLKKAEAENAARRASQAQWAGSYNNTGHFQTPATNPDLTRNAEFVSQLSHPSSFQQGGGGAVGNPGYGQQRDGNGARHGSGSGQLPYGPGAGAGGGRIWQNSPQQGGATPMDDSRPAMYNVSQHRHETGSVQQKPTDRVMGGGGFATPQPATMQNRTNQNYGNWGNSQPMKQPAPYTRDGYENMPPPPPPHMARQHGFSQEARAWSQGGQMHHQTSREGFDSGARPADEEKRKLQEELAEKTGAVSLLKSRLSQADKEIYELKIRGRQSNGQVGPDQQRELNRMSSELMFKDQELLEAKRARSNKEEELKAVMAALAASKQELESLKLSRQIELEERERRQVQINGNVKEEDMSMLADSSPTEHQGDGHAGSKATCPSIPPSDSGGVSAKGKEKMDSDMQIEETVSARAEVPAGAAVKATRATASDLARQRILETKYSLQQLWGLQAGKEDTVDILPKLLTASRQEVYLLLNASDSGVQDAPQQQDAPTVIHSGTQSRKRKSPDRAHPDTMPSTSLKLHNAISKIASRTASPVTIITPLLEFCHATDPEVVWCALHTLRNVLQKDSSCRDAVLNGLSRFNIKRQTGSLGPVSSHNSYARQGWWISKNDTTSAIGVPVFSSPRIFCQIKGQDKVKADMVVSKQSLAKDQDHVEVRQGNATESHISEDEGAPEMADMSGGNNAFIAWIFNKISSSSSPQLQAEAAAIIKLLVAHTEALTTRTRFGVFLFDGSLASLLQKKAEPEVQHCAVRIVLLLLHCPEIYKSFCTASNGLETTATGTTEDGGKLEARAPEDMEVDNGLEERMEGRVVTTEEGRHEATPSATATADGAEDILDGLSACLTFTGTRLEEYALRRSTVRVLTFLALSGDMGAATILRTLRASRAHKQDLWKKMQNGAHTARDSSDAVPLKKGNGRGSGTRVSTSKSQAKASGTQKTNALPWQLVSLMDSELDAEEEEEHSLRFTRSEANAERASLLGEALHLLSRLTTLPTTSSAILSSLTLTSHTLRQSLSVANRLISRCYSPHVTRSQKLSAQFADMIQLAKDLRERILSSVPSSSSKDPPPNGKEAQDAPAS